MIHAESLAAVSSGVTSDKWQVTSSKALRSPGLFQKHYSPKAKLLVLKWSDDKELKMHLVTRNLSPATCFVIAHTTIPAGGSFAM